MPDQTFENISSKKFEQLANVLGTEYIARGLRPFGSGTDGGREATYEGKMKYPSDTAPWDGYLVVQCKQKEERGKTSKEEADWAIAQLDIEMAKYQPDGKTKKKRRIPKYFLFVTNAQLSAQLDTGGKDRFVTRLKYWAEELGIIDADVWDRDKLNNLLDGSQKIAERFGMLHDGDIMAYVAQNVLAHRNGIDTTLAIFLQEELRADQFVNLAQAGHTNDDRTPLARVFVDLSAVERENKRKRFRVVDSVQRASDRPIYPSLLEYERQSADQQDELLNIDSDEFSESAKGEESDEFIETIPSELESNSEGAAIQESTYPQWLNPSRYVIVGGPGQGKSTLAQHLAQRHRAALLKARTTSDLEPETERIMRVVEDSAAESGTGLPTHPRWPFRIVLEHFADALAKREVASVLEYIANRIRHRTGRAFEAQDVEMLLATTSWFVAFDGLDEVPAVSNRKEVLDAVRRFLLEARDKDADLLVIATTRPQGYEDDFAEVNFNHLSLVQLSKEDALVYAKKFVEAKYATDPDRRARIMQRLEAASHEEATARLMESPLQVTIMAALVDLVGNPPRDRYELFQRYYDVIYQREQERGLTLSGVLAQYKAHIKILHDQIGLLLQIEAESRGKTESRLSRARLEKLIHDYLVAEEFEGDLLERTKRNFIDVAVDRLVFLVPVQDGRFGFEVRSLQEFSAARALMRGPYEALKIRLQSVAPVPYWRNTILFAIGGAFFEKNVPLCDMIMQLCRELNDPEQNVLLARILAGSRLALDILEDGIVESQPRNRRLFFETALQLVQSPHAKTARRLANEYTPNDEERYKTAIAAANNKDAVPLGILIVLAVVEHLAEGSTWAWPMLRELWPTRLEDEQLVLEQVTQDLWWGDEWTEPMIERVARASHLSWVSRQLARFVPTKWIRDSSVITRGKSITVRLATEGSSFSYFLGLHTATQEILERLEEAQPTHESWLPFTLGRNFFAQLTPESLADFLEALAPHYTINNYYPGLSWHLQNIINEYSSSDELRMYAQRAREGGLGSAQDWRAAEARWKEHNFTSADLEIFTDEEWPFTAEIATRGIPTHSSFSIEEEIDIPHATANALLASFANMTSARRRADIANNLSYVFTYTYLLNSPFILPLPTVLELIITSKRDYGLCQAFSVLDPNLDWTEEITNLDLLGKHISAFEEFDETPPQLIRLLAEKSSLFISLLGTKHIREGILHILAALAVHTANITVPTVNYHSLTLKGQADVIAINLFSLNPRLSAADITQQIMKLWQAEEDGAEGVQMSQIIHMLLRRAVLLSHQIDVLNRLYISTMVEARVKHQIIDTFISQLQYRTSRLNDKSRKTELGMNWLFEALETKEPIEYELPF